VGIVALVARLCLRGKSSLKDLQLCMKLGGIGISIEMLLETRLKIPHIFPITKSFNSFCEM
jgi:hypothetical protein